MANTTDTARVAARSTIRDAINGLLTRLVLIRCSIFHRNYHAFDQVYDAKWGARVERRMCKRCPAKVMGS